LRPPLMEELDDELGLADAAQPVDCGPTAVAEQPAELGQLDLAADEARDGVGRNAGPRLRRAAARLRSGGGGRRPPGRPGGGRRAAARRAARCSVSRPSASARRTTVLRRGALRTPRSRALTA